MRKVSAARVSQWISEGKIGQEALVGEGQRAQINVEIADRHLRERLDVHQRFGLNGLSTLLPSETLLDDEAPPIAPPPSSAYASALPPPLASPKESVEDQIKREKLLQQQLQTRRLIEADNANRGRYVLAADARNEHAKIASDLLKFFDGWLTSAATAVAEQFGVPQRDVLHKLRIEFREGRARLATHLRQLAEDEAAIVDDDGDLGSGSA